MSSESYSNRHFQVVTLIILFLTLFGMGGYILLEGWPWFDALYMTLISISTVGFKEIRELSFVGRVLTMFIILAGMVTVAMLSASVTSFFVRNDLLTNRKRYRMRKEIEKLNEHTILCGAGDTGRTIINEFRRSNRPLVVIEQKQETVDLLELQYPGLLVLTGDATKDESLIEANIYQAGGLITALSLDADNLFVVISARALNQKLTLISRSLDPLTDPKLYRSGANYVISPNMVEGLRMASVILRPTVMSFLDVVMSDEELELRMEEIRVSRESNLAGKSLADAKIPQRTGLIVIAIRKAEDEKWMFNPSSATMINGGDTLIVLGKSHKVDKLLALLKES